MRCAIILGTLGMALLPACGKAPTQPSYEPVVVSQQAPEPRAAVPTLTATAEREPAHCEGMRLTIKAVRESGYTKFVGTIVNGGSSPVVLVKAGDGSEEGWRTPILTWKAVTSSGAPGKARDVGRCGNMNSIHE